MNEVIEKIMEYIWYNPKKALAVGLFSGAVLSKLSKKGIVALALALIAGKIYLDAEKEQSEFIEEE
ncbi:MAG: hypothetical protein E7415_00520 [Ruminococcaceae bacterium]|nr:hypothetical protein [Oscillospiraceae bacterium]